MKIITNKIRFRSAALALILAVWTLNTESTHAASDDATPHSFIVSDDAFLLDGKPFIVKAAELHYPRIPKEYRDHRIKMVKALGMNTICLYVFWNVHESEPGVFDFSGENDLREFIELCAANDMKVILRPGPYVCAEWEMGGLPWWLLRDKDIKLRSDDPRFLKAVERFEAAVAEQAADLTVDKGGPIIMVQVENEYGSFGKNKKYVSQIRDILRRYYGDTVLFQCDWSSNFLDNGLEDLLWTLNFGTGSDIDKEFAPLREARPDTPLMCSEFWSGWYDKWGQPHETRPADQMISNIEDMLSKGISFSLYMTHGGTNRGHWSGANSPGYAPLVTSYDYDAPINEQGTVTKKYHLLRGLMERYLAPGEKLPTIPDPVPTMAIAPFHLNEYYPLFDNLPEPILSDSVKTFEELGFGYGTAIYRTRIPALSDGARLTVTEPHDFARIYVDGHYAGTLDRRLGQTTAILPACEAGSTLDIVVEATGRINFGTEIKDFKGITESAVLMPGPESDPITLTAWEIYPLPDTEEFYDSISREALSVNTDGTGPGVYRGTFTIEGTPGDTFLDFSGWGKGLVYVNGHALGRYWHIGPQQTIYTPGVWLKEGENEIMIFDVIGPSSRCVEGLAEPILDVLK